jgi:tRNA pseudouridine55 synthase
VVNFIRSLIKRFYQIRKLKVGHAGTLDPLASGLLILCTGKMTKRIQEFQDQDKIYTGTFLLGKTTPSYDSETEPDAVFPTDHIDSEMIEATRKLFLGEQQQIPPNFSAIKVDGKRAFDYARKQQEVKLNSRTIFIHRLELDKNNFPEIAFETACSKGTYIRSLVYDFGNALNSGAYLTSLRRTQIGVFNVKNAFTPEQMKTLLIAASPTQQEFKFLKNT